MKLRSIKSVHRVFVPFPDLWRQAPCCPDCQHANTSECEIPWSGPGNVQFQSVLALPPELTMAEKLGSTSQSPKRSTLSNRTHKPVSHTCRCPQYIKDVDSFCLAGLPSLSHSPSLYLYFCFFCSSLSLSLSLCLSLSRSLVSMGDQVARCSFHRLVVCTHNCFVTA